jgi:hypothetical protein
VISGTSLKRRYQVIYSSCEETVNENLA